MPFLISQINNRTESILGCLSDHEQMLESWISGYRNPLAHNRAFRYSRQRYSAILWSIGIETLRMRTSKDWHETVEKCVEYEGED